MSTQVRLKRTIRICGVEENRLNVLLGQRNLLDKDIHDSQSRIAELIRQRDHQQIGTGNRVTIEQLTQCHTWMDGLDVKVHAESQRRDALLQQREKLQVKIVTQRSRLKGLEMLVDQLRLSLLSEQQAEQNLLADEQAIREYAGADQ